MKSVYDQAGIRGFFVGWRIRFFMYFLHAVMTVDLLERLEGLNKKLRNQN